MDGVSEREGTGRGREKGSEIKRGVTSETEEE